MDLDNSQESGANASAAIISVIALLFGWIIMSKVPPQSPEYAASVQMYLISALTSFSIGTALGMFASGRFKIVGVTLACLCGVSVVFTALMILTWNWTI